MALIAVVSGLVIIANEGPEAYDKWLKRFKKIDFHHFVTQLSDISENAPWGDIVLWLVAVCLVSLLIWLLYTKPKEGWDRGYFDHLEARRPGARERRKGRKGRKR